MPKFILQILMLCLLASLAQAAPILDQWNGSGPYATGQGNRVVNALAVSADGMTVFAGTGSGTAFVFPYSDTTAPTLSAGVSGITQTAATLTATSSEAGSGYWIVVASNAAAPSSAQVKAGVAYSGVSIVAFGSGAMSAAVAKAFAVNGLTAKASYDLYFAAEDASVNLTALPVKLPFATPALIDNTPDAFSFTPQTGVSPGTAATSNTIAVSGINTGAAIGIVGGSYSIDGGAFTSAAGVVNNGQTVSVQQTSSSSFGVLTTATLSIGGVSGTFDVTTLPPVTSYTAPAAVATGDITASFSGGDAGCGYSVSQYIPLTGHPASPPAGTAPAGVVFPHGLFDFTTSGCTPGSTITMTITYPQALPVGTVYWKYGPTPTDGSPHWYQLPATISGNTATFSIADGGLGDDDLTANGTIVDQGGPGVPVAPVGATPIPTLSEWALLLLAGLTGLFGVGAMRRRGAP